MTLFKKVNKNGSITIPQELRHKMGIHSGKSLELIETTEGILLKEYVATCLLCGSFENVKEIHKYSICVSCAKSVIERSTKNDNARSEK